MSRADQYEPIELAAAERWFDYGSEGGPVFPRLVGIVVEEVRRDYCRMRLGWRAEITQPAGVAHGGALASLIDTVVVPAIASGYDDETSFVTIDLHISYLGALIDEDAIAEGWVVQRGGSVVFCAAEVVGARTGRLIATGTLTYKLIKARA